MDDRKHRVIALAAVFALAMLHAGCEKGGECQPCRSAEPFCDADPSGQGHMTCVNDWCVPQDGSCIVPASDEAGDEATVLSADRDCGASGTSG